MPKLLLATRNPGKVREFQKLLAGVPDLALLSLADVPSAPEVVEDGDTFAANARKKALEIARATSLLVLSDDSGLEVDALGGRPGVRSARYAGEHASDEDNCRKLIAELTALAVPEPAAAARYRVVLALAAPTGPLAADPHLEDGTCEGRIVLHPRGQGGFGYDPHFVPEGETRTMAELSADEKNRISHRARAATKMRRFLEAYLLSL